jgi:hypothetical protein
MLAHVAGSNTVAEGSGPGDRILNSGRCQGQGQARRVPVLPDGRSLAPCCYVRVQ